MFGISFSELFVITIVALLVVGPEKLPKLARTIGALTGRVQRYVGQVKEEVNREFRFEELQKLQQEIKQSVEAAQSNVQRQHIEAIENAAVSQHDDELTAPQDAIQKPIRKQRVAKPKSPAADKNLTEKNG